MTFEGRCEAKRSSAMSTVKQIIDEAIDLSCDGDFEGAHNLLTRAIELDPSSARRISSGPSP